MTECAGLANVRAGGPVQLPGSLALSELPALDLLSEHELTAIVAPDLGHEYTWTEWSEARRR